MTKYITYTKDEFVYVTTEKNEHILIKDIEINDEDIDDYDRYENIHDGYVSIRLDTNVRVG